MLTVCNWPCIFLRVNIRQHIWQRTPKYKYIRSMQSNNSVTINASDEFPSSGTKMMRIALWNWKALMMSFPTLGSETWSCLHSSRLTTQTIGEFNKEEFYITWDNNRAAHASFQHACYFSCRVGILPTRVLLFVPYALLPTRVLLFVLRRYSSNTHFTFRAAYVFFQHAWYFSFG